VAVQVVKNCLKASLKSSPGCKEEKPPTCKRSVTIEAFHRIVLTIPPHKLVYVLVEQEYVGIEDSDSVLKIGVSNEGIAENFEPS
jgi:hypothetical protein